MDVLPFLMLPVAFGLMFLGVQVAFAMMITAVLFGLVVFGDKVVHQFIEKIDDLSSNFVFAAIPLFVFMGAMLEKSGIADRLFEAIHIWTRRLPGGLALATIIMCIIFAASSGVIGATESVVGLLTIPVMLRYGYDKGLISGTICAGGSLGTIIPPSVVVIVMGPLADLSVGDLMYGMVFPGLIMAGLYLVYVFVLCLLRPSYGPRIPPEPGDPRFGEKVLITLRNLVPPVFMIFAVLGSILLGWASPTEAAAIGALCAVGLTVLYGQFTWSGLYDALIKTLTITAMIMAVLLAGTLFTGVFIGGGGINTASRLIQTMQLDPWALLALMLFVVFLAGFFLDWISIVLIFVPIFTPLAVQAGFNGVWFCILFLIIIQTSYLTPPMAPAIFYLRAVAPAEITIRHMYRGVVPFITLQVVTLGITMAWPGLVTWLPTVMLQLR
ncbi:MAG: TRAP transporter large permease subunit [Burkholderiaceae bacterium]|jgi:tripartite ATP-independent transporter DctM subunit|nr:TRAP transporter large permease subunit [Burkholderiales bacterium]MCZ8106076.1 TRAP transporter large permease subunit [Burkholderiales bacterium]MCZ8338024.1 TRAP transporter large permease subunit [Burkholderiaceae bacterium]